MYAMIPAILLASPVVGFVLGSLLCKWTGAGDWLKALMAMLGVAAGANEVVRIIKRASSGQ
jgi:F0F1-type ATP synthase assembly protein I